MIRHTVANGLVSTVVRQVIVFLSRSAIFAESLALRPGRLRNGALDIIFRKDDHRLEAMPLVRILL